MNARLMQSGWWFSFKFVRMKTYTGKQGSRTKPYFTDSTSTGCSCSHTYEERERLSWVSLDVRTLTCLENLSWVSSLAWDYLIWVIIKGRFKSPIKSWLLNKNMYLVFVLGVKKNKNVIGSVIFILITEKYINLSEACFSCLSVYWGCDEWVYPHIHGVKRIKSVLKHHKLRIPIPCSLSQLLCSTAWSQEWWYTERQSFIVENWFVYPRFSFPYEDENCSLHVCKELCWNFHGDCIESVDCFP